MLRPIFVLLAWAACSVPLLAAERDPSDFVRVLEEGPREKWDVAARRLVRYDKQYKRYELDARSLGSLLKRWDALSLETRHLIARGMKWNSGRRTPEAVEIFARLLRDPDARIREAAFQSVTTSSNPVTARILAAYDPPTEHDQVKLVRHLVQVYYGEHNRKQGGQPEAGTLTERSAGVHDELFSILVPFFSHSSAAVRKDLAERVINVADERVNDLLYQMWADEEAGVTAMLTLAKRGDARACGPLHEWAKSRIIARKGSEAYYYTKPDDPKWRAQRFSWLGGYCGLLQPARLMDLYRKAQNPQDRLDRMQMLSGIPIWPSVTTELRAVLNEAAADSDPELKRWASERLETIAGYEKKRAWQDRESREEAVLREGLRYGLAGSLLAAGALGLFVFLWGFRMLQLRRLLQHLAPANARTVTLGLVSLRGEVHPVAGKMLVHPVTEESCVYYAGAEDETAGLRFWLADETGRVLVDPRGVVLISEDQTLVPGERVHILGTAVRTQEGDGSTRTLVHQGEGKRMLVEWLLILPVRLLFGLFGASARIAATLFTRPERSFWIWDDLHQTPMTTQRDLITVFLSMLAAAAWITLFVAAAIAVLERTVTLYS
jgi:hypothetical protein